MAVTNERTGKRARILRRHENAVIQAEVRRMARAMAPHRMLRRDALRTAEAEGWQESGLDRALSRVVEESRLNRLSADF